MGENVKNDLYQALFAYQNREIVPMHMPGHKRRVHTAPDLPWHLDISEIDGFDNLHAPAGILREAQDCAASLWGSAGAHFLINGSTGGILAGIYACTRPGDRVLIARNSHKSVYHAIELLQLRPVYLKPPIIEGLELCGSIEPQAVERALRQYPDIRLAVITSPTYEGVLSDVGAIAKILHGNNIPLLVDEAHGAHLGLSQYFPKSAVSQGADIVVQSLHKTLPSLTQTAILHWRGSLVSRERLFHALAVFQSTSPSYPLMASIDSCVALLRDRGEELLSLWHKRLERFYRVAQDLRHLSLLTGERDSRRIYAHDPGKIAILCGGTSYSGGGLLNILREDFGIELEMALEAYALAMTSPNSTDEDFSRLREALLTLDQRARPTSPRSPIPMPPMPDQDMDIGEALRQSGREVLISESMGEISKAYVWAYPPGIPLLVPGQQITMEVVASIEALSARHVLLHGIDGGKIAVIDK